MLYALPLILALTGCKDESCDRTGYEPLRVFLVSAEPAPAAAVSGGCVVYTDMPVDTQDPDRAGTPDTQRHIGEGIYQCLTGGATGDASAHSGDAFYTEVLWFRIDGQCQFRGCFSYECRAVDTNLSAIGLPECVGVGMTQWSDACWTQFYKVLAHETAHGWLGRFHG